MAAPSAGLRPVLRSTGTLGFPHRPAPSDRQNRRGDGTGGECLDVVDVFGPRAVVGEGGVQDAGSAVGLDVGPKGVRLEAARSGALFQERAVVRRLPAGHEFLREAWLPEKGFGWPTRVVTAQRMDDPREIITIGFSDISAEQGEALLAQVGLDTSGEQATEPAPESGDEHLGEVADEQLARRSRISEVIEPEMTRTFYLQLAEDDLT